MTFRQGSAFLAAMAAGLSITGHAMAWGSSGHRLVTQAAIESLPATLPAFMRTQRFAADAAEIARDPDRERKAGRALDSDWEPAHFVDVGDDGKIAGGPAIDALPMTREEFDTALRAVGSDSWKTGFLPYAIVDGWEKLAKDIAVWRADAAGEKLDASHQAWFKADRERREGLILDDLGVWSHFVGDGSYPLHVTPHHDGWGKFPNPNGYTTERIHVRLEGPYVAKVVTLEAVKKHMAPFNDCKCYIEVRAGQYLATSQKQVEPFYALEKDGGFKDGDARGVDYITGRVAFGAQTLRDMIIEAWNASGRMGVGYPNAPPAADFEAGKVADIYGLLHSND